MIGKVSFAAALAVGLGTSAATPAPAAAQSVSSIIACPIVLFFNPGTGSVSDYLDCSAFGPIAQGNGDGIFTNAAAAAVSSGNSNGFVTSPPSGGAVPASR